MVNAEGNLIDNTKIDQNMQGIVHQYLALDYETFKNMSAPNTDTLIVGGEFKNYVDQKLKLTAKWRKKIDLKITDYQINKTITNVTMQPDNTAIVEVTLDASVHFNSDVLYNLNGEKHIILMQKNGDNWIILSEVFDENEIPSVEKIKDKEYIKTKKASLDKAEKNFDQEYKNYKDILSSAKTEPQSNSMQAMAVTAALTTKTYNRSSACSYAYTWYNTRNPNYPYYIDNDCTNFVSQCVFAGAPAENVSRGWYCHMIDQVYQIYDVGSAWPSVVPFYNFITTNSSYAGPYTSSVLTGKTGASIGDPIEFYKDSEAKWSHAALITSIGTNPQELYYTQHSTNKQNAPLSLVYPNGGYSQIRVLHIGGYNQ
jgi:hypothetical protein